MPYRIHAPSPAQLMKAKRAELKERAAKEQRRQAFQRKQAKVEAERAQRQQAK
jgi:hypothetical protein